MRGTTPTRPQKTANEPFLQAAVRRFGSTQSTPRVVIPPFLHTRGKPGVQGVQATISTKAKKITQPSGAATPRNGDAQERIAVPQALCILRERTRPSSKSGKVCRFDTRPGDVRERAERSEGSKIILFEFASRCSQSRVLPRGKNNSQ